MQSRDIVSRARKWWIARRRLVGVAVYTAVVVGAMAFLLGWSYETATQLRCEGGPDRAVTCTVTSRYRFRTTETVVAGVTGVGVREGSSDGDDCYWLELLTASGPAGPALTWEFDEWRRAKREADRLAEVIAVAPGHGVAGQTRTPLLWFEVVVWLLYLALAAVISGATIPIGADLMDGARRRLRRTA